MRFQYKFERKIIIFENIDLIGDLIAARTNAVKNAVTDEQIQEINKAFQLRKISITNENFTHSLKEIKVQTTIECSSDFMGAEYIQEKLIVKIPQFAFATDGTDIISKNKHPKDGNTFAIYFSSEEYQPYFIIT